MRLLLALVLTLGLALTSPVAAQGVKPPGSPGPRVVYLQVIQGDSVRLENGDWIVPPEPWRLLYEWTQWCLGKTGPAFDSIQWGLADAIHTRGFPWAGVTLQNGPTGRPVVIYNRTMISDYNLLVHEMIHAIGGPAAGEWHPPMDPSPAFRTCLPIFRYS